MSSGADLTEEFFAEVDGRVPPLLREQQARMRAALRAAAAAGR